MKVYNNFLRVIGNAHIVILDNVPNVTVKIYVKPEFLNLSGSIKYRMANIHNIA